MLANQPYIVGEREPEVFTPNVSGVITPASKLDNGGGDTFIINAQGSTMTEREFRQVIKDVLAERDRQFGQRRKGY